MNEHIGPVNLAAMGREYLAQADIMGEKVAQLRRKYRQTHDKMLLEQIDNWKEIEDDLRHQGLELLRRDERRRKQNKEDLL
ncbi:hypothetical protein AALD01_05120 [Oscillospiraceae bacterium 21-37]